MLKTLGAALAALFLTLMLAGIASAQTTYTDAGPSYCLGASHYPPETPYSFQCSSSGSIVVPGVFQVEFYGNHIGIFVAGLVPWAWGDMTAVTTWVAPICPYGTKSCTTLGAIAFTWEVPEADGTLHTGSFSATVDGIRDWRGWFHPKLTDIVLTANN